MAKGKGMNPLLVVGLVALLVIAANYYGAFNPQNWNYPAQNPANPAIPVTTVTAPAPAPSGGTFNGPATWTVTSRNGDTKGALDLTPAVFWIQHNDGSYAGTPVQATGTAVYIPPTDNGRMILVVRYLTTTVGFVDPAKTKAQNPLYMKEAMYLKDVDTNGQMDQCYPLDVSWVSIIAGQTVATIIIDLISWPADVAVNILSVSQPTGMSVAGDYHATGYISAIAEGTQWQVQIIRLTANATAPTMGTIFAAGTTTVKAFTLKGTGAQTNTIYGGQWKPGGEGGAFAFASSSYDSANQRWDIFKASSSTGAVDVSQVNYGMGFVNERQSGTTWLQFDVWIHTTGDITAAQTHQLTVSITFTNPAGAQTTATLTQVYTGA